MKIIYRVKAISTIGGIRVIALFLQNIVMYYFEISLILRIFSFIIILRIEILKHENIVAIVKPGQVKILTSIKL